MTIDVPGAITELRLAQAATAPLPAPDGRPGRLRVATTRELIIGRELNDTGAPLTVPEATPKPTEANSWVTYTDVQGRFHFRHPQEFRPPGPQEGPTIDLARYRPQGFDLITFQLQPRTGDPQADRRLRDPDFQYQTLKEQWRLNKLDAIPGKKGWLPEAEWAEAKMKVHRTEVVLRATGAAARGAQRLHFDQYLVLFGQDESLIVEARTTLDDPIPFRDKAEDILKTFRFETTASDRPPAATAPRSPRP